MRYIKALVIGIFISILLVFGINEYTTTIEDIYHRQNITMHQQELLIQYFQGELPNLVKESLPLCVYVEVVADDGWEWSGSGVIVASNIILTAGHVVEDADKIVVITDSNEMYNAIGWYEDEKNDCGIIVLRSEFKDYAQFADSNELLIGESVYIVGSPYGKELFNNVTFGIISGLNRDADFFGECGMITSDAAANPGNSGGPVFNMRGEIIGILVGGINGADGISFITPSNICKKLLESEV